ncbi:MAG: aminoacyl-tRNA hydrolase [Bacilli bacterium]|nr:aminoacyl-tRNA hydrolase [Bacilli bacterium]MDD4809084.1 aminoacyl-tRNA hydrolase [Bacilli bacterium]
MKLIIGLGNPGKEYQDTRHNMGFLMLDKMVENLNLDFKLKNGGKYSDTIINGEKVVFLKPQQFINLSGQVIKKYMDYYKIDTEDILVIHDDLDLEVGTFKLRVKGGSAGHNGLKDIERCLNTKNYKRLKIGISNNKNIDTKDYVIGKYSKTEKKLLDEVLKLGPNILKDFLELSFDNLMNKYN